MSSAPIFYECIKIQISGVIIAMQDADWIALYSEKNQMDDYEGLCIKRAESRIDLGTFIRVPWHIYRNDLNWVPPLFQERRMHLSRKNPYFSHADCRFWIALDKERAVGRISAQVDRLYLDRYGDATGFWGMLEAEDDIEIFQALFNRAGEWLQKQGMKRALGPFNLSINQECGLLVKGFDSPPSMMMGHAPPYYAERLKQLGYRKAKDLIAYSIRKDPDIIKRIQGLLGSRKDEFQTRPLRKSQLERELDIMFGIFNDAWSGNWGFVPFTRAEYLDVGKSMGLLADARLIRIAESKGEPAGFIAALPNLNEIIGDLDGRLFPLGWLKLLWRIKFHKFKSGRILLMGVLKKHQDGLTGASISLSLIRDVINEILGSAISELELSWILEDNIPMRRIIEALGGEAYKIYRIYEKEIPFS